MAKRTNEKHSYRKESVEDLQAGIDSFGGPSKAPKWLIDRYKAARKLNRAVKENQPNLTSPLKKKRQNLRLKPKIRKGTGVPT